MAPIKILDKIPDGELLFIDDDGVLDKVDIYKLGFKKKMVIFGVPGAFTPICSLEHVPGYLGKQSLLHKKGVSIIICLSINDPFVMKEWAKKYASQTMGKQGNIVQFLADGSGIYTKSLGLEHNLEKKHMGIRSRRYSLLIDNLIVQQVNVEATEGMFEISTAEAMLHMLDDLTHNN